MSKRSEFLSIIIALSLAISLFVPLGQAVYAARQRYNDEKTFYLPIVDEVDPLLDE